ncbi:non-specific serine/threonine protein kinase [Malassezia psittaci]|uniref:non-specific serine/threonine protein kinase n=1 Tax=Malassezia psittaci TaxID=1821823 RepID=A0AAF0F9C0_9BASI|nr:non-specific serine/threonine protein kinase [Malassezia psittaci]
MHASVLPELLPDWLQNSPALDEDASSEEREVVANSVARRLLREYVEPIASAQNVEELQSHFSKETNGISYVDVTRLLCSILSTSPRALDTLPAAVPNEACTTLDLYLVPRVLAALAVLGAHANASSSLEPCAQQYPQWFAESLSEAVAATMQLLGTALHLGFESAHQPMNGRYILYDALRMATRTLPLDMMDTPFTTLATHSAPEAFHSRKISPPCASASNYTWHEADQKPQALQLASLPSGAAACFLCLCVRLSAELAYVFPSALYDLVELGVRLLLAHWERDVRPGIAALGVVHVSFPYVALLRYDACVIALPLLRLSVAPMHVLRLCIASFSMLFHPVDDPYFHMESEVGLYTSTYLRACEQLSEALHRLRKLISDEQIKSSGLLAELRLLQPSLTAHLRGETSVEQGELELDVLPIAFRRCCLALLCILLSLDQGSTSDSDSIVSFQAKWASASDLEALRSVLRLRGHKRKLNANPGSPEDTSIPNPAHDSSEECPAHIDHCVSCSELVPSEITNASDAFTVQLEVLQPDAADVEQVNQLMRLAVHSTPQIISESIGERLQGCLSSWLIHSQRSMRLAAGRMLWIVLEKYSNLPRDKRRKNWSDDLRCLASLPVKSLQKQIPLLQETSILTLAQLGRVRRDETLGEVTAALIQALYLPHVFLRALAYTEAMQLAAKRRCTTFQLLSPFLARIAPIAVDAMYTAPHGLHELAKLLNMSQQTFLHTTLEHTVPHLVNEMVGGRRDEALQAFRAIASAVGTSVPALCLNQTSDIFKRFFLEDQLTRDAALETLISLLGSRAVTITSLLRSRLHEVLGYLVARLGDPRRETQALAGLEYVRSVVTAPPSRWKEADLHSFLRDEVLAILTWINEELSAVHGKISVARKAVTARSVGKLVQLIGVTASRVAPQILACLSSTLSEPELALATLESWHDFVQVLRGEDMGPFVGQTAAALLGVWSQLGSEEKQVASAILRQSIITHGVELESYIDAVPSLDAIQDDVPDVARQLRAARHVWVDEDHFRHILARVAHDNIAVCVQSLHELREFFNERRSVVESWTSGNVFHPLIGECVRVLLSVAGRAEVPNAECQSLCLECLGMLGAVDPDRMDLPPEEPFFVLLSNFENPDETVVFAIRLLTELVVPAFRATSDTKHQAALAYAIQELLKFCGFTPALLDGNTRTVSEKIHKRWQSIPEAMLPTLMPLLNSKYVVHHHEPRRRPLPIYLHSNSFRDWIQAWVLQLMQNISDSNVAAFFHIFRSVVRDQDITIARAMLPHLALHTLISGSHDARSAVLDEIHCVLTDQVAPSSGSSTERRRLTTQTVFHLMDHIGHWMRRVRLVHARSSKRSRLKEALQNVQGVMDDISQELTAQASLQTHAYPRSLLNFEYRIRSLRQTSPSNDTQLQQLYETMHEIYAQLDDPDGMEGISTRVLSPSLQHQIREHESTGRWTDAQSCWEVELQQRPDNPNLHLGLLRCLRSLGHYDTLRTHIRGVLSVHPDWQSQFAPFQIEGACILADWAAVKKLAAKSQDVPAFAMAGALLAMRENDQIQFNRAICDARTQLGQPLLGTGRIGYTHMYDSLTQFHMLHELEMVFSTTGLNDARLALDRSLHARFRATLPSFRTREPVLSVRRSAFLACASRMPVQSAIGQAWILTAKTARRAGHMQTAYSAVLQAVQNNAPYAFVQKAKLLAHSDKIQAALQELAHALHLRDATVGAGGTTESAADRRALARAHLLHARLVEETARFQHNEIIQHYKTCTALDPDSEKVWYCLGHFYDSPNGGMVGNQMLLQLNVCRFYMKSAQNGTRFLYRTLPRMLTIWLDAGTELAASETNATTQSATEDARQTRTQFDKINEMMRKSVRHLARYQWFAVFPQLVARIVHKNESVWAVILEIIVAVLLSYPQQSLWALIAGSHAKDRKRKQRYECIVARIRAVPDRAHSEVARIVDAFEHLSSELLQLCELPVGKETSLSLSKHFPALLSTVQTTPLILPLQSSITVTLPPSDVVSQTHRPFPSNIPTIAGFDDNIEIMHSLQKPRKIIVQASNGNRYPFLCKPRDDLRKDARLMEFDAMINKLLQASSESRRRRLYIRTYAVLILNEECGLIEWVPNTVAYRQILTKHYAALDVPLYTSDLKAIFEEARAQPKHATTLFEEKVLTRYPPVFHAWFLETFPEPGAWLRARSAYARTAAVMSMVGFVLGLGDRHGDNILFDALSGDTVHVDLNCLFDKGTTFEIPERVPFRLTHNMVDALGVTGVEGAFRRTAEITMSILRDNKESLMSVLQAMVHDPLGEWVATDRRARHKNASASTDRPGASTGARKALQSVSNKLDGKLHRPGLSDEVQHTTKNLVHMLICDATSAQNLSQMYIGWAPYL